ncbi:hypothetical protein EVAR_54853_1 [Eumeta japonica]|uniref:Uncharacterized protein n=1 Tax=Eumeta variegata TaxID=151549 RepID=A0A4C1YBS9_EUMVA|nr:hypothetical protein EVAR_54853_1 [Eumeta japonica]
MPIDLPSSSLYMIIFLTICGCGVLRGDAPRARRVAAVDARPPGVDCIDEMVYLSCIVPDLYELIVDVYSPIIFLLQREGRGSSAHRAGAACGYANVTMFIPKPMPTIPQQTTTYMKLTVYGHGFPPSRVACLLVSVMIPLETHRIAYLIDLKQKRGSTGKESETRLRCKNAEYAR